MVTILLYNKSNYLFSRVKCLRNLKVLITKPISTLIPVIYCNLNYNANCNIFLSRGKNRISHKFIVLLQKIYICIYSLMKKYKRKPYTIIQNICNNGLL